MNTEDATSTGSDETAILELWKEYEKVAMHFNELMMRWRLQAIGGLAGLVTLAGFVVGDVADETRYRAMVLLAILFASAWVGVAAIDLFYYRRLLKGAVDALIDLEKRTPLITLSTTIENRAKVGGIVMPYVFYAAGFLPLLVIMAYALWRLCQLAGGVPGT